MERKILLVEDDPLVQEAVMDYFISKGWQVQAADRGDDALALLAQNSFQLILLDVMLPGINGFTVCRKLRETSDVPVIFITARVMEEDELNGYLLGADDYVTKPFSLPVLHAKAKALLRRAGSGKMQRRLQAGSLEIDVHTHEVLNHGRPVSLPPEGI